MNWIASKRLLVLEQGPQRWLRHWSICHMRRGCKSCHCSAWSRAGLVGGGSHQCVWKPCGVREWRNSKAVLSVAHWLGKWQQHRVQHIFYSGQWSKTGSGAQREDLPLLGAKVLLFSSQHYITYCYIDWVQLSQCLMGYSLVLIPYEAYLNSLPFSLFPV